MITSERSGRRGYPSDLTDEEWDIVGPFVPPPIWLPNLQEPQHHPRELLDAIRYRVRTGVAWRSIPADFPPWPTVMKAYYRWTRSGVLQSIHDALRQMVRVAEGRSRDPTAAILDSQSVKSTDVGGPKGFDAGKKGQRTQAASTR